MKEDGGTNLSKEEKHILREALKKTGCLPNTQGKVVVHISPQTTVSSVEINMTRR